MSMYGRGATPDIFFDTPWEMRQKIKSMEPWLRLIWEEYLDENFPMSAKNIADNKRAKKKLRKYDKRNL